MTFAALLAEAARIVAVMGEPIECASVTSGVLSLEWSAFSLEWKTGTPGALRFAKVTWIPGDEEDDGVVIGVRRWREDAREAHMGQAWPTGAQLNELRAWLDGGPAPGWCS